MENCNMYRVGKKNRTRKKNRKTKNIIKNYQAELTKKQTPAERKFKAFLKQYEISYQFQKIIKTNNKYYIVDFYLPEHHIIVEIDGDYHLDHQQSIKDSTRTNSLLKCQKVAKVIRFWNNEIMIKDFISLFIARLIPPTLLKSVSISSHSDGEISDELPRLPTPHLVRAEG